MTYPPPTYMSPRELRAKRTLAVILFVAIAGAAALFATSCAGGAARDNALMPAIQQAWPGVKADLDRGFLVQPGTVDQTAEARLDFAIRAGDRAAVNLNDWIIVQPMAGVGIADRLAKGEIGPNGWNSLRERLRLFDQSIRSLNQPFVPR